MKKISGFLVGTRHQHPNLLTSDSIVIGDYAIHPIDCMVQIEEKVYVHVDKWTFDRVISEGRASVSAVVLGNDFFFARDEAIAHVIDLLDIQIANDLNKAKVAAHLIEEWRAKLNLNAAVRLS